MSERQTLVPIDERSVDFYGDAIIGVLIDHEGERRIYVPVRLICENLGLAWGSQRNRIYRDDVLREELRGVFIMNTPGSGGGRQETPLPAYRDDPWLSLRSDAWQGSA